ncbi:MAG: hypothetical protein M0D55_17145 [Elusimicrobiota bacterium]|nr:MAG: hypothetical protein M0D55_17145 [Elusimicrobiota bacterium]
MKVSLEIRPGDGGLEISGFRAENPGSARVQAAVSLEIARRLEPSYRVDKTQRSLDGLVDSRASRRALDATLDPMTGRAKLEASYDPKTGKVYAGKGRGVDVELRFGRDESGALRLEGVDAPGRAAPLPAALEHNLRVFAGRRTVEPASSRFRRGETAESLDATLKRSLEVADARVRAETLVRDRALKADLRAARAERRAALEAKTTGALHSELMNAASKAVEAKRAAEFARSDVAAAEAQIAALSRTGRKALPRLEETYRELARASSERAKAVAAVDGAADRPAAEAAARRALDAELKAAEDFSVARRGSTDGAIDALVRRENARSRLEAAGADEAAALRDLDSALASARGADVPVDIRLSLAEGRLAGARASFKAQRAQIEYRRDGIARAIGADGSDLSRARLLLEVGAVGPAAGRLNVGQQLGRQHCALATAADMYAAKTGAPIETAMKFAEDAVTAKFQAEARAERTGSGEPRADWEAAGRERALAFLSDTGINGMNRPQIEWVMNAVAEASGLRAVSLGAGDSPFSRLAAGEQIGVVLADASAGGHMVNLSNWRKAKNPLTGREEAWLDVADPNTRVLAGVGPDGALVYEARTYSMRAADLVPQIRSRFGRGDLSAAAYVFEGGPAGARSPPMDAAALARRMGATERVGAGDPVPGVRRPEGFDAPAKVLDPAMLQDGVHSAEIMGVAREYGLVFELGPSSLSRLKPGVDHNFVIVENPNGTIEMTVGRVVGGNAKEVGVKHVALADGRPVPFAGTIRVDAATGRPTLDFNSGSYSRAGLDPRWNPTPENARPLAAYAEAILKRPVDVVNHFDGRLIEFRGTPREGVGAARTVDLASNRAILGAGQRGSRRSLLDPPGDWTAGDAGRPRAQIVRELSTEGSSAIVYEGRLDGGPVAIKTYTAPLRGPADWPRTLEYFRNEVSNYRVLESALPKGQVAKLHGEVEVGGNPSFATEMIRGKDHFALTAAEARNIRPEAIEQAADAVNRLGRRGVGGTDSPQPMILTADQVINGVQRRAGDVVFMDAGALSKDQSKWMKPSALAEDVAMARELGRRAGPEFAAMKVEQLYAALPKDVVAQARAVAKAEAELAEAGSAARLRAGEGVGAAPEPPKLIARTGASRGEGWTVDGRPATRLSGGGFKEVLIHPSNEQLVIKLFSELGAKDTASSLSEKRAELRNLEPLLEVGRAPKVVDQGAVKFQAPGRGEQTTGFVVQERVAGRELGDMLRDPDPAVRSRALAETRALFEDLIAGRIKLEDRVKMSENLSIGRAAGAGPEKAWVLDAGEVSRVAKPGLVDRALGRPDPLRTYYESVLADLAKLSRRAEPVIARGRAERVGAAPDPVRYEKYFSAAEIRAAHPEPASGGVYHDWQHTVKVADMAGEFAKARGLGAADAKFVSEVALLHDFDPSRAGGMPARVPATIEALRADFAGTRSLNGETGRSVLKERFGWSESQLKMAEAMIQRTEFPFAEKHPSPAYAEKSPLARYTEMLEGLSPGDRRFVLREAALLSEYADKSSWYATEGFRGAHKVVEGLVNEINTATGGKAQMNVQKLGTADFLGVIGEPASFSHDMALARRFGVKLKLPGRAEAFAKLPEVYGRTFESNLRGFRELDAALKAGDADPVARGEAAADVAFAAAPRREGVGARPALPAETEAAARRRFEQNFARTPDFPNSPVFVQNSRAANDLFNRWLEGREGNMPLKQAMESMHHLYAGKGEIGKGQGGQYAPEGAPSNGRAQVTRDYVKRFGLEANKDGHVPLPGIPENMQPLFLGSRYFYPDSSIPGMRETYYKALEGQLGRYSELVVRLEALKAADPAGYKSRPEYEALLTQSLDAVADFGRVAAAFRQFKNGNWGLYGPMMNSMVARLGFEIRSPGYLDILLQGATESSFKPFFQKAIREGREFHTADRFDPTTNKIREPLAQPAPLPEVAAVAARPEAAPRAAPEARNGPLAAGSPVDVPYKGPITLRIGGENGKVLEVLSRADLARRLPGVAATIGDPRVTHVLVDPQNPAQLKGLRLNDTFELGRSAPGRFELAQQVSGRHLKVTVVSDGGSPAIRVEDVGSRNGTVLVSGGAPEAPLARPVLAPREGASSCSSAARRSRSSRAPNSSPASRSSSRTSCPRSPTSCSIRPTRPSSRRCARASRSCSAPRRPAASSSAPASRRSTRG